MTALITALPDPPSRADPSTFSDKSDALLGALPTFVTETNAVAVEINGSVISSAAYAAEAQVSAVTAAANAALAGATAWVSGTSYSIGDARYSLVNFQVYRRKTAGAGTTDPALDPSVWAATQLMPMPITVTTTTYTAGAQDHCVITNVATTTITLPASPSLGDTVWVTVTNNLTTNVIARNGKTIMGSATDLTLDLPYQTTRLRFVNIGGANTDWRFV